MTPTIITRHVYAHLTDTSRPLYSRTSEGTTMHGTCASIQCVRTDASLTQESTRFEWPHMCSRSDWPKVPPVGLARFITGRRHRRLGFDGAAHDLRYALNLGPVLLPRRRSRCYFRLVFRARAIRADNAHVALLEVAHVAIQTPKVMRMTGAWY